MTDAQAVPRTDDLYQLIKSALKGARGLASDNDEPGLDLELANAIDALVVLTERAEAASLVTAPDLDVETLARAMARLAEVGPPAHVDVALAEEHWRAYVTEAEDTLAEVAKIRAAASPTDHSAPPSEALRDLIRDLAHEYHHSGSIRDHADPNDKTGWNVHGIETCDDRLCVEALAFLASSDRDASPATPDARPEDAE